MIIVIIVVLALATHHFLCQIRRQMSQTRQPGLPAWPPSSTICMDACGSVMHHAVTWSHAEWRDFSPSFMTDDLVCHSIRKLMGGGRRAKYKKKIAQGEIKWKKILARQLTLKNIHAMAYKKIHTRNLITKKNSCGSKIPLPPSPITSFPNVGSFWIVVGSLWDRCGSLWVVVDRCGSLWVVPGFSNYG